MRFLIYVKGFCNMDYLLNQFNPSIQYNFSLSYVAIVYLKLWFIYIHRSLIFRCYHKCLFILSLPIPSWVTDLLYNNHGRTSYVRSMISISVIYMYLQYIVCLSIIYSMLTVYSMLIYLE